MRRWRSWYTPILWSAIVLGGGWLLTVMLATAAPASSQAAFEGYFFVFLIVPIWFIGLVVWVLVALSNRVRGWRGDRTKQPAEDSWAGWRGRGPS